MPLILVVEPDGRQADALASLLTGRLQAELVQARSAADGVSRLGGRVPDLILTAPLLSPKDDAVLAGHFRDLGRAAAHVQTLTIPVLETPQAGRRRSGVLSKLRRSRDNGAAPDGCDPHLFAEEVALYLARAAEERQAAADYTPAGEPLDAVDVPAVSIALQGAGESVAAAAWSTHDVVSPSVLQQFPETTPADEPVTPEAVPEQMESADVDAPGWSAIHAPDDAGDTPVVAQEETSAEAELPDLLATTPMAAEPDAAAAHGDMALASSETHRAGIAAQPQATVVPDAVDAPSDVADESATTGDSELTVTSTAAVTCAEVEPDPEPRTDPESDTLPEECGPPVVAQALGIIPADTTQTALSPLATDAAAVPCAPAATTDQDELVSLDGDELTFVFDDPALERATSPLAPSCEAPPDADSTVVDEALLELSVADDVKELREVARDPQRTGPMQWARDAIANIDTVYAAVRAAWGPSAPEVVAIDADQQADILVVDSMLTADDDTGGMLAIYAPDVPAPVRDDAAVELDLTEQIEALSLAGYAAFIVCPDDAPDFDADAAVQVELTLEDFAAPIEPPQFYEITVALEREIDVAPAPTPAPAPEVKPVKGNRRRAKGKPIQDEWGMFDPTQCGFAALVDKLDEVTGHEDDDDHRSTVRVVSYQ